jgi:hypothetical protein
MTVNAQKRRSIMVTPPNNWNAVFINDSSAALTGATSTLESQPFAALAGGQGPKTAIANANLYRAEPGEYPMIFGKNEGFELQFVIPNIASTLSLYIGIAWDEVENY